MILSLITAMSSNRVIGINNQLPWKLAEDLAWFKKQTLNKTIVMGRKTWESLPLRPLPDRKHIIISRDKNYQVRNHKGITVDNVFVVNSIENAIELESSLVDESLDQTSSAQHELMFVGGEQIYHLALPLCQRLYLTQIHQNIEGDAFFPNYQQYAWNEVFLQKNSTQQQNKQSLYYDFLILERKI